MTTEDETVTAPEPARSGRIRSLGPVIAAALCVPCVVLIVIFTLRLHTYSQTNHARSQAVTSARTAAAALLAYDYRHIGDDVTAAKKLITSPFSGQYAETTATLQSQAVQLKAIVQANVRTVSVESATRNRVVVLLFVDQSSVKQLPGQSQPVSRLDEQRVRFTMVHAHGRWLVSEVAALLLT